MKRKTLTVAIPMVMVLAGRLLAGGFFLQLGNPEASAEARKMNAVLTVIAAGCHDPAAAKVTAKAIGVVNGEPKAIPLDLVKLPTPGMYAIAQQWPKGGNWVIQLEARDGSLFTNTLVKAGPEGIDRFHARAAMTQFAPGDVKAMLED